MNDDDEPKRPMGARPRIPKVPNPVNESKRAKKRAADEGQQPVQREPVEQGPLSLIPPFDAHSILTSDHSLFQGVIGPVYDQYGESCASVVICRLLQAFHNRDKPIALHHEFCIRDLANHVKTKTGRLSIRNLNIAYDYIVDRGLLKKSDGSRSNATHGLRIHGRFDGKRGATRDEVYAKAAETPLGISLEDVRGLKGLQREIYDVPIHRIIDNQPGFGVPPSDSDHTLLVAAKGTNTGKDFLVIQNSWGTGWGNNGYARISLNPLGKYDIFWPVEVMK